MGVSRYSLKVVIAFRIRAVNDDGAAVNDRWFSHFPVRLGRNPLNDFVVPLPFISQFHAVIEQQNHRLKIRDLGSKNGIVLATGRVRPHESVPISPDSCSFSIFSLRFEIMREDARLSAPIDLRTGFPFVPQRFHPAIPVPSHQNTKSVFLSDLNQEARHAPPLAHDLVEDSVSQPTLVRGKTLDLSETQPELTIIRPPSVIDPNIPQVPMPSFELVEDPLGIEPDVGSVPGVTKELADNLRPLVGLRANSRGTFARLLVSLARDAEQLTPAQRDELFAWVAKKLPWILGEPDFLRAAELYGVRVKAVQGLDATEPPVARVALEGLRWLAGTLAPHAPPLEAEDQVVEFVSRIRNTIDVFVRSFIPLRDGHRAFTSGMDIVRASRPDERLEALAVRQVEKGQSVEEVAGALLDFGNKDDGPHRAVEGAFADLMIHEIALLQGVMRGVKSLLGELAPERVEAALDTERGKGNVGLTFGPYLYRALWRLYRRRHADIDDGEGVAFAYVFGPEFARTYQRLIDDAEGQGPGDESKSDVG